MSYQLRPYQTDLLDRIDKAWFSGSRSLLCQLPTGSGKTVCFSHVIHQAIKDGLKCLVLAHREELIKQAADKIEIITNDPVGIIKAGYPTNYERAIQVASVQSLTRRLKHCPMLAKHLGYKRGWAWHRFQEQQTLQQVLELSA